MWQGVPLAQFLYSTVPHPRSSQSHGNVKPKLCLHLAGKETHNPKPTSTSAAAGPVLTLLPVAVQSCTSVPRQTCSQIHMLLLLISNLQKK